MSVRSLNKVQLIGNLTRDPELRFTPAGTAVCTFGLATNRSWTTQTGETKEETEFHRIVSWNKLAELCSQLLTKGRKVYVEGRLATHSWTGQDGAQRSSTEIVIEDMIILDSKKIHLETTEVIEEKTEAKTTEPIMPDKVSISEEDSVKKPKKSVKKETIEQKTEVKKDETSSKPSPTVDVTEDITPDDIPF